MAKDIFQTTLEEALAALPAEFRAKLETVRIVVQARPTADQLAEAGCEPDESLYGLFEGVPLLEKDATNPQLFPDRVTIFRAPLEVDFPDRDELRAEIRVTLLHELGHYCGFSEDDLAARGYD